RAIRSDQSKTTGVSLSGGNFAPSVLERDRSVEDRFAGRAVLRVGGEIAEALELVELTGARGRKRGFEFGGDDFERLGVHDFQEIILGGGLRNREETVVEAHLGLD